MCHGNGVVDYNRGVMRLGWHASWLLVLASAGCDLLSALGGGRNLPCDDDQACPPGHLCIDQRCQPVTTCSHDGDCAAGWRCEPSGRVCVTISGIDAAPPDAARADGPVDGSTTDQAIRDRWAPENEHPDLTVRDVAALDLAHADHQALDASPAEGGSVEVGLSDTGTTDAPIVSGCGNGFVNDPEACDDANERSGDGCDDSCQIEPFFACSGQPSMCHCVYYVYDGISPFADGSRWWSPLPGLQAGIDLAPPGCQVWAVAGHYDVYRTSADDSIVLASGVGVYGSFAGTENSVAERQPEANISFLHGMGSAPTSRVHHVVTATNVFGAVFDGFKIQHGAAAGGGGGGMLVTDSTLTVANCEFFDNEATQRGGAILVTSMLQYSDLTLTHCAFSSNHADEGAAVACINGARLVVRDSLFFGNVANIRGGAIFNFAESTTEVINSVFSNNSATTATGGALMNWDSSISVVNSTIAYNGAGSYGGAIRNYGATTCTIANSIMWGDTPDEISNVSTSCTVSHTDVAGGQTGTGNIAADPQFANDLGGNFRLLVSSPCIDLADDRLAPPLDIDGVSRYDLPDRGVDGTAADLGAYEYNPS